MYARLDPNIRIAVRALIISDHSLLVQHKVYEDGTERFVLPGGKPEPGETLEQGLQRECLEEIGVEPRIGELLHVADLFKPRDTDPPSTRHQLEIIFSCEVPSSYTPRNGPHPDKHQVNVIWLDNMKIINNLWPAGIAQLISQKENRGTVYLGRVE